MKKRILLSICLMALLGPAALADAPTHLPQWPTPIPPVGVVNESVVWGVVVIDTVNTIIQIIPR